MKRCTGDSGWDGGLLLQDREQYGMEETYHERRQPCLVRDSDNQKPFSHRD